MNRGAHKPAGLLTLTMFTGLMTFILAMAIIFFTLYTLIQTGQSFLGHITYTSIGWPYP